MSWSTGSSTNQPHLSANPPYMMRNHHQTGALLPVTRTLVGSAGLASPDERLSHKVIHKGLLLDALILYRRPPVQVLSPLVVVGGFKPSPTSTPQTKLAVNRLRKSPCSGQVLTIAVARCCGYQEHGDRAL